MYVGFQMTGMSTHVKLMVLMGLFLQWYCNGSASHQRQLCATNIPVTTQEKRVWNIFGHMNPPPCKAHKMLSQAKPWEIHGKLYIHQLLQLLIRKTAEKRKNINRALKESKYQRRDQLPLKLKINRFLGMK